MCTKHYWSYSLNSEVLHRIGLTQRDYKTLIEIFEKYDSVNDVRLFGSRAKGTHKPGSDIDLAIMNQGVDYLNELRIKGDCEESSLPYFVDIANYPTLKNEEFRSHIDRVSIPFYKNEIKAEVNS